MLTSVGLGELGVEASMSHLLTHASFKAGLFLAAGVVIMSSGGYMNPEKKKYSLKSNIRILNNIFLTYKYTV